MRMGSYVSRPSATAATVVTQPANPTKVRTSANGTAWSAWALARARSVRGAATAAVGGAVRLAGARTTRELGGPPAHIHHQVWRCVTGRCGTQGPSSAGKGKPRLLVPADDLRTDAQDLLDARDELGPVLRVPAGAGGDETYPRDAKLLDLLRVCRA